MKRIVRGLIVAVTAAALLALLGGIASGSRPGSIRMNDHGSSGGSFAPEDAETTLQKDGAEATWSYAAYTNAQHDVVEDNGLFKSPGKSGIDSKYRVELSAGSYPYYCSFHGLPGRGMHGVVAVAPVAKSLRTVRERITWATGDSTSGNRFDVDWRVKGSRQWHHWKKSTAARSAAFGKGSPTQIKPSKRYEVRVRSRDSQHASHKSDFSPSVTFGG